MLQMGFDFWMQHINYMVDTLFHILLLYPRV